MRKIYRRSRFNKSNEKKTRTNQQIRVPEVQLIDDEGQFLGTMPTSKALAMAQENGLELVEVNPKADPPVCKIIDYGKYKYDQEKKLKRQKLQQKKSEVKGLRLSFRIGKHDLDVRKKQALKHLSQGDKLKIEMNLRGRENQHFLIAKNTVNEFIASINEEIPVKTDEPIKKMGTKLFTVISTTQKQ
jgi:translation initiation factor IF-3